MSRISVLFSVFFSGFVFAQPDSSNIQPIPWKLNWQTEIGLTSYRTNMLMHNGFLFVGSNGDDRNSNNDSKDGVYVINPKDGSIQHQINGLSLDDNDVNGLAISSKEILYFGSDAHYVYAYDLSDYSERWKYKVPADIEGVPALTDLNNDGSEDVIVNVEGIGIWAFDGLNGAVLWKKEIDTHNGNVSPLAIDVNEDGISDIVCGGYSYFALDGKNGEILWKYEKSSGVHASPLALIQADSIQFYFFSSYGDFDILDTKGTPYAGAGISYGLFSSPCPSGESMYVGHGKSWHSGNVVGSFSSDLSKWNWEDRKEKFGPSDETNHYTEKSNVTSATAISLDIDNDGNVEFLIPDEFDVIYIIHPEKEETEFIGMPTGAEASLAVFDYNNDGQFELYFLGLDGIIRSYQLNSAKKIVWNSFRGKNNDGILNLDND